tara:strand:+ start:505 stop:681 length:177 start_codon:yes stop_codon:yes gene_type:complete
MKYLFKPSSKLLALLMFLPVTPSIAAITVFTQSVFIDRNNEISIVPQHTKRVLDASKN